MLLNQAKAMQQLTMFGDEAILGVMASIGAFTDNEEAILKSTQATIDMASALGMDLKGAGDLVAKTLGSTTNALTRYGVTVTGAVGSTERLESMTRGVANLWGGMASAEADTYTGKMAQMSNAIGDTMEVLGEGLAPVITEIAYVIKAGAEALSEFIGANRESEFETAIRQIEEMGGNANDFKIALYESMLAQKQMNNSHLPALVDLTAQLNQSEKDRLDSVKEQADAHKTLLDLGLTEDTAWDELMRKEKDHWSAENEQQGQFLHFQSKLSDTQEQDLLNALAVLEEKRIEQQINQNMIEDTEEMVRLRQEDVKFQIRINSLKVGGAVTPQAPDGTPTIGIPAGTTESEEAIAKFYLKQHALTINALSMEEATLIAHVDNMAVTWEEAEALKTQITEHYAGKRKQATVNESIGFAKSLGSMLGALSQFSGESKKAQIRQARMQQAQAVVNTYASAMASISPPSGSPNNPASWMMFATAIITGIAQVSKIQQGISDIQKAQTGADFIANKPTTMMVGEGGQSERVTVTPIGTPSAFEGGGVGGSVVINISSPLLDDSVADEIIPRIREAVSRGESLGM